MNKKAERLSELIGGIDDKFIEESEPNEAKKSRLPVFISIGGAACAAAVLGLFLLKGGAVTGGDIPVQPNSPQTSEASYPAPEFTIDTRIPNVTESGLTLPEESIPPVSEEIPITTLPIETADVTDVPELTTVPPTGLIPVAADLDDLPFEYDGRKPEIIAYGGIGVGAMGFEGIYSDDIEKEYSRNNNPWNKYLAIPELPVFKGTGIYCAFDPQRVLPELERIAAALGAELTDVTYREMPLDIFPPEVRGELEGKTAEISARAGNAEIHVQGEDMNINIEISDPEIPDWWEDDIHSVEMAEKTARFYAEKYAALLGYDEYELSTNDYGYINTQIFQSSGNTFNDILYFNFRRARAHIMVHPLTGENTLTISINDTLDIAECTGLYPTIFLTEAQEKLISGDFATTVPKEYLPNGITEDRIKYVELVYKSTSDWRYILPYYRFLVELDEPEGAQKENGEKLYGGFYVPAISAEYIENVDTNVRFN